MKIDPSYIRRMADQIKEMLGDEFDEQTFLDTLDGETDAMDVVGYLIRQREEAKAHAESCKALSDQYLARKKRLDTKAANMVAVLGEVLDAMGERKVAHPLGTVSRTKGRDKVVIEDETQIPSQLMVVTKKPDAKEIKKQLDAGENVPGAKIETGDEGISIRIK